MMYNWLHTQTYMTWKHDHKYTQTHGNRNDDYCDFMNVIRALMA